MFSCLLMFAKKCKTLKTQTRVEITTKLVKGSEIGSNENCATNRFVLFHNRIQ